jgi:hypothetical protein
MSSCDAGGAVAACGVGEADLLEQHGDLEHVADVVGHRDHVVRHDPASHAGDRFGRGLEDGQFGQRPLAEPGVGMAQQPRRTHLGPEQLDPIGLAESEVVVADAGLREEVGEHRFVHGRVLAQVEPTEMGPEDRDRPPHRFDQVIGDRSGTVAVQRRDHLVEIVDQLGQIGVRRTVADRRWAGHVDVRIERSAGEGVQPGVHAPQCSPVGLVGAERRVVARCRGEPRISSLGVTSRSVIDNRRDSPYRAVR